MAIYKRVGKKKVSYQVFWHDDQGKQHARCFDRKKDAEAWEAKVKVSKRENKYPDVFQVKKETITTFNELADRYVENYKTQKSFHTFKGFIIRDLREEFGERKLSQITYLDLETYRNSLRTNLSIRGGPRADASVNNRLAVFSHMMNKAVEWGMLEASPFKKGRQLKLKINNQRLRFLSEEEIESLLTACPHHLRPIVETALLTGMRRGELLGLKWEQIRNGFIYLTDTKGGKARQIPINNRLEEVLREVRRRNQLKSEYVFCDSQGKRFYEVKTSFQGACKRAGVEDFRFHDLRHTFASRLVMRGASIKAVQELLGHADLTMTMRYAHLSHEHLRDSVNLLNDTPILKNLKISGPALHPSSAKSL